MSGRRITIVTDELRGLQPAGGIATSTTFLALGLARMGHDVEMLHLGTPGKKTVDDEWSRVYARAGVGIRFVPDPEDAVEPRYFAWLPETQAALRADPPDVVIAQDSAAPAYGALRLRQLGFGFEKTLFVVACHGTRLWLKDVARTVRVFPYLLGVNALERASLELADIVVSPSQFLVDWMRRQGWQLPETTLVIPFLSRSAATGEEAPRAVIADGGVQRLTYFSRLEEKKGLNLFASALNALEPPLLERIDVEFLGAPMQAWSPERARALLSDTARTTVRHISFQTDLDQPQALERLAQPGTLAVMPSLGESFGHGVYECLERGIPFIASNAGATPELIAADDHARVLFDPTAEALEAALRRVLRDGEPPRPARAAFDPHDAYEQWCEVVACAAAPRRRSGERPRVDVVVESDACREPVERQTYENVNLIVAGTRRAGLAACTARYVVFLDDRDEPAENLVASLVDAQAASDADIVTVGLRLHDPPRQHLFVGDPGALGLLSNAYGTTALIRRSLLEQIVDDDWPLLASLHLAGARIVSIPLPLVTRSESPASIERNPDEAQRVVLDYEQALPAELRPLARIAAGLAAASADGSEVRPGTRVDRIRRRLGR